MLFGVSRWSHIYIYIPYSPNSFCCRGSGGLSSVLWFCPWGREGIYGDPLLCTGIVNGDGRLRPSAAEWSVAQLLLKKHICFGTFSLQDTSGLLGASWVPWVPPGCLLGASWVPPGVPLGASWVPSDLSQVVSTRISQPSDLSQVVSTRISQPSYLSQVISTRISQPSDPSQVILVK